MTVTSTSTRRKTKKNQGVAARQSEPKLTTEPNTELTIESNPKSTPTNGFKATVNPDTLTEKLAIVMRAIPKKAPSHPILAHVLIEADKETQMLKLTAFDLRTSITTRCPATIENSGSWTVHARLLESLSKNLPQSPITLAVNLDTQQVDLISNLSIYHLPGLPFTEYPNVPALPDSEPFTWKVEVFAGAMNVLIAASKNEKTPILNGATLRFHSGSVQVAATDGHRLATYEHSSSRRILSDPNQPSTPPDTAQDQELTMLTVPTKDLQVCEQILNSLAMETLSLHYNGNGIVGFEMGDSEVVMTTRLLSGTYPNWPSLLPTEFQNTLTVNRQALMNALCRIHLLAEQSCDSNKTMELAIDSEHQQLRCCVETLNAGSGAEALNAKVQSESLTIAFNAKYLLDGVLAADSEEIRIQINTNTSPVVLEAVGDKSFKYLILPLSTNG